MYRGSCTDQNFESQSCGQYCYGDNFVNGGKRSPTIDGPGHIIDQISAAIGQQCGIWACGDNKFACDIPVCDTANFTVPSATMQVNAAVETDLGSIQATSTVTTSAGQVTVTATVTSASESTMTAAAKAGLSAGAGAGIGVGIGLPLLAAAAVLLMMFLRERQKGRAYKTELDTVSSSSTDPLASVIPGRHEKDGQARSELTAHRNTSRFELQS